MNKGEAEKVVKDTIEYANKEIEKSKKRYRTTSLIIFAIICLLIIIFIRKVVIINNIENMASKANYNWNNRKIYF